MVTLSCCCGGFLVAMMGNDRFQIATTWDRFHLLRILPSFIYWSLLSAVAFIVGDLLIATYGERRMLWTQAAFAALVAALPLSGHYSALAFRKMVLGLGPVLWDGQQSCIQWLEPRVRQIFTLSVWSSKIVTGLIVVLGLVTVVFLGLPFVSLEINVLALLYFTILLAMCGHAAYVVFRLAEVLIELTGRTPRLPFFLFPHPSIAQLSTFHLGVSAAVAFGYGLVTMAVFRSPYGMQPLLAIWLTVLAFYPLGLFLLWFVRVRQLNQSIRFSYERK